MERSGATCWLVATTVLLLSVSVICFLICVDLRHLRTISALRPSPQDDALADIRQSPLMGELTEPRVLELVPAGDDGSQAVMYRYVHQRCFPRLGLVRRGSRPCRSEPTIASPLATPHCFFSPPSASEAVYNVGADRLRVGWWGGSASHGERPWRRRRRGLARCKPQRRRKSSAPMVWALRPISAWRSCNGSAGIERNRKGVGSEHDYETGHGR